MRVDFHVMKSQSGNSSVVEFGFMFFLVAVLGLGLNILGSSRTGLAAYSFNSSAYMDELSQKVIDLSKNIDSLDTCVPVISSYDKNFITSYLYCSPSAKSIEGRSVRISKNFKVESELARRFHFWKRVYTLWSHSQYALHSAEYPEVVLEIIDTKISSGSDKFKNRLADNHLKKQAVIYKRILKNMHKLSKQGRESEFTPVMQRIADIMDHISDKDKYLRVANNLRIQRGQQQEIQRGLVYASPYMKYIKEAFNNEGVPEELAMIAFIESSFNLRAESKVGAVGVYQIMPDTGAQYMIVNEEIDERRDPIKSARAAAKLFKLNYKQTDSWPLAITAYNHGVGSMLKAIDQVGSHDIVKIIDGYKAKSFGFASKNFYTGYLAILYTLNNVETIFPDLKLKPALKYKNVKLNKQTWIADIKTEYSLSTATIVKYNPDLSKFLVENDGYLPKGYVLKVPSNKYNSSIAMVN